MREDEEKSRPTAKRPRKINVQKRKERNSDDNEAYPCLRELYKVQGKDGRMEETKKKKKETKWQYTMMRIHKSIMNAPRTT